LDLFLEASGALAGVKLASNLDFDFLLKQLVEEASGSNVALRNLADEWLNQP
jgi:hypothetical protein